MLAVDERKGAKGLLALYVFDIGAAVLVVVILRRRWGRRRGKGNRRNTAPSVISRKCCLNFIRIRVEIPSRRKKCAICFLCRYRSVPASRTLPAFSKLSKMSSRGGFRGSSRGGGDRGGRGGGFRGGAGKSLLSLSGGTNTTLRGSEHILETFCLG